MYEFTDKKVRQEFKKTKYGKTVSIYILISYIIFCVTLFISVLATILLKQNFFEILYSIRNMSKMNIPQLLCYLSYLFCLLSITLLLYFDGKRDGAIEQYKRIKK